MAMKECLTLKKSNCKNCYKCIRNCPVKSIRFSGNQAHIIGNECILCGKCVVVCPQHAKQITNEVESVKVYMMSGAPVIVSIAPSFIANFPGVGIEAMTRALIQLGFTDVEETALGATMVKTEYERILAEGERDVFITSCCHSVNLLIQKHFPRVLPYLADVKSPMQAHCADIKKRFPDAKTVFIGPCLSKKDEAQRYPDLVDAVLTFEELSDWLEEEGIELEKEMDSNPKSRARFFPEPGGVLKTMTEMNPKYTYLAIDGVQNCIEVLQDIEAGNIHNCVIEMNACAGACIGGPAMAQQNSDRIRKLMAIEKYAGEEDFEVDQPGEFEMKKVHYVIEKQLHTPTEQEIMAALRKMGKRTKADELNCGSCGYDSCREKAIAVCQGKAETSMCLPYLMESAENFSDTIVQNMFNGIIVTNTDLEIQQINPSAMKMLNVRSASDVLGEMIVRLLDPDMYFEVMETGKPINDRVEYLSDYGKYIKFTVIYDKDQNITVTILRDVTEETRAKERKEVLSSQTIEVADKVVEKQMRIVQEIASLLGETAAETKIALTKLKESINNE